MDHIYQQLMTHSQVPCHTNNPSTGAQPGVVRKRVFAEDDLVASEFANIAKSIKSLVEVETANAAAMQNAFVHELEVQKQIAARRNQLFPMQSKLSGFTLNKL